MCVCVCGKLEIPKTFKGSIHISKILKLKNLTLWLPNLYFNFNITLPFILYKIILTPLKKYIIPKKALALHDL